MLKTIYDFRNLACDKQSFSFIFQRSCFFVKIKRSHPSLILGKSPSRDHKAILNNLARFLRKKISCKILQDKKIISQVLARCRVFKDSAKYLLPRAVEFSSNWYFWFAISIIYCRRLAKFNWPDDVLWPPNLTNHIFPRNYIISTTL